MPRRYAIAHMLAEAGNLTDMRGPERELAGIVLRNAIDLLEELPASSRDACASPQRLALA